jgi:hypothetical protein
MSAINVSQLPPICPGCGCRHAEQVADCPLCERSWRQGALGNLGVWDGLAIPGEDDEEDNGYAAYVACGCGFVGPSKATCVDAIRAWNKNATLIRQRLTQGVPINPNVVRDDLISLGFIQQEAA